MWTNLVCFICLKKIPQSSVISAATSEKISEKVSTINRLLLLSHQLLNLPESITSTLSKAVSGTSETHFCSHCENAVRRTHELYTELCAIETKLAWRLAQISDLLENQENRISSKLSTLLLHNLASQLSFENHEEGVRKVKAFRTQLAKHCRKPELFTKKLEVCVNPLPSVFLSKENATFIVAPFDPTSDASLVVPEESRSLLHIDKIVKIERDEDIFIPECSDSGDMLGMEWEGSPNTSPENLLDGEGPTGDLELDLEGNSVQLDTVDSEAVVDQMVKVEFENTGNVSTSKLQKCKRSAPTTKKRKLQSVPKAPRKMKPEQPPSGSSNWTCEICGSTKQKTLNHQKRHLQRIHEKHWFLQNEGVKPPFPCYFCYRSFPFQQSREVHMKIHQHVSTSLGEFACTEDSCFDDKSMSHVFSNMEEMNAHFHQKHTQEQIFRCSTCDWPFLSNDVKEVHELSHMYKHCRKDLLCPKCPEKFIFFSQLLIHYAYQHTNLDSSFKLCKCSTCGYQCNSIEIMHEHKRTHIKKKLPLNFSCDLCKKKFPTETMLKTHLAGHELRQCSTCGKMIQASRLWVHKKMNHDEKTNTCSICGSGFAQKYRLTQHMKTVHQETKVRDLKCQVCQEEFKKGGRGGRALLLKHLKEAHQLDQVMIMQPGFVCSLCGKGYYHKVSLDQHFDRMHTKESERKWNFKCEVCQKEFWRQSLLSKHLEEMHRGGTSVISSVERGKNRKN